MQLSYSFLLIFSIIHSLDCQDSNTNIKTLLNSRLNYFDTDLLRYAAEDKQGNIMLSPASIKSVLAMLLEGSGGETEAEIRSALRLSPNKNDFREQLNAYLTTLRANSPGTQLENANAVFVSDKIGKQIRKDYEQNLKNVYLSQVSQVSFLQPAVSANIINNWVSRKTKGLIPVLVEPASINPAADILLVNALYFKSAWAKAFFDDTKPACFYSRGACTNVAMMNLYAELNYAFVENLRSHAVELPYVGGRYSMVIIVPQDRDGHHTLIRDLPYMSLPQISELMEKTDVELSLPRFTVDYNEDLVPILKKMRINSVFTSSSNLSGIFEGKQSASVTNLFHKVHVDVNEKGTIAAAATGAVVIPLISNGAQLIVDRPFIFFIRDNELGLVLFEGKIEEPTRWEDSGLVGRKPLRPGNRKPVLGRR